MKLLRIEWLKLRGFSALWWILAAYPLAVGGLTFLMTRVQQMILTKAGALTQQMGPPPFSFPAVWHTVAYIASFFHFIPCLIVLVSICNEFQFRTHRQNLLDGWSRRQFFLSKVLMSVAVSLYATLTVAVIALLTGIVTSGTPTLDGLQFLGSFAAESLSYAFLALLIGFVLKRGLLGLGFFLLYSSILDHLLSWFAGRAQPVLGYLTPLATVNNLLPFPVLRQAAKQLALDCPSQDVLLLVGAGYCALYIGLSWALFRRQDL